MQSITRSQTATGDSTPILMDIFASPFNATIQVAIVGGTATVTSYFTLDDPKDFATQALYLSGATWTALVLLTAVTATTASNVAFPVRALKTTVSAISGATVTTTVIQAGLATS